MVERDVAALRRVSLAARVCFARAKNTSSVSAYQYSEYLVAPNGDIVSTQELGKAIANLTYIRSDLDILVCGWNRLERHEFASEVMFWFASSAGILFTLLGWRLMFNSNFDFGSALYFGLISSMFATHFRSRLAQRHNQIDLIEKRWHKEDIPGAIAAVRSGNMKWAYKPSFFEGVTTPII